MILETVIGFGLLATSCWSMVTAEGDRSIYMTSVCPQTVHIGPDVTTTLAGDGTANVSTGYIYGAQEDYTRATARQCNLYLNVTDLRYRITLTLIYTDFCKQTDVVKIYNGLIGSAPKSFGEIATIHQNTKSLYITSDGTTLTISLQREDCAKTLPRGYVGFKMQYFLSEHVASSTGLSTANIVGIAIAGVVGCAFLIGLIICGLYSVSRTSSTLTTPVSRLDSNGTRSPNSRSKKVAYPELDGTDSRRGDTPTLNIMNNSNGYNTVQKHHLRQWGGNDL